MGGAPLWEGNILCENNAQKVANLSEIKLCEFPWRKTIPRNNIETKRSNVNEM